MSEIDEVSGLFDVVDSEASAHDPVTEPAKEPVAEGGDAPEAEQKTKTEETKTEEVAEEQVPEVPESAQGQGELQQPTEAAEPSQEELKEEAPSDDWRINLPPPPPEYQGPEPEVDESGQITNMTPRQYEDYLIGKAEARATRKMYDATVESASFEAAEKVLPELKTNPVIRKLVENARVASVVDGQPVDTVAAALQVKEALGIAPQQIAQARAEGERNARVSIEEQSRASIETGDTQPEPEDVGGGLIKRAQAGDDEAIGDLIGLWEKEGRL